MAERLQYQEVEGYAKRHPDSQAYFLDTANAPFGRLHITDTTGALIWQGRLEFTELHTEALSSLPAKVGHALPIDYPIRSAVVLLATTNDDDELLEFDLSNDAQYAEYQQTLDTDVDRITFARYDVRVPVSNVPWGPELNFSFTAENPQYSSTSCAELGLQVPRTQSWSPPLLAWVLHHHANLSREAVDIREVTTIITDLCRPNNE